MKKRIGKNLCFGWLLMVGLVIAMAGCSGEKTSDKDLSYISPDEGVSLAAGKKTLLGLGGEVNGVWLDPRNEREYITEHIPGSLHVPFNKLDAMYAALAEYDTLIVYGDGYNSPIAQAMSKALIQKGHDDVRTLKGGLRAWKEAGNDVEEGRGS